MACSSQAAGSAAPMQRVMAGALALAALAVAGCSAPAFGEVARAEFNGTGTGRDTGDPFACHGPGRIAVESSTPEGWLSVSLTDPTGQEALGQVFDGGPDPGRSGGTFDFKGAKGPGWVLAVERHGYGDTDRFDGSYIVRVSC